MSSGNGSGCDFWRNSQTAAPPIKPDATVPAAVPSTTTSPSTSSSSSSSLYAAVMAAAVASWSGQSAPTVSPATNTLAAAGVHPSSRINDSLGKCNVDSGCDTGARRTKSMDAAKNPYSPRFVIVSI